MSSASAAAAGSSSNGSVGESDGGHYDNVFPPLAGGGGGIPAPATQPRTTWAKPPHKMSLRSSTVTQVFTVPVEERRFKEMTEQQFGEKGGQQAKICQDIMNKTGE